MVIYRKFPPIPSNKKKSFPFHPSSYSIDLSFVKPFRFFFVRTKSRSDFPAPSCRGSGGKFHGRDRFQKKITESTPYSEDHPRTCKWWWDYPHENVSHLWNRPWNGLKESHNLRSESLPDLRILSPFGQNHLENFTLWWMFQVPPISPPHKKKKK